jgi:hypothetical protein
MSGACLPAEKRARGRGAGVADGWGRAVSGRGDSVARGRAHGRMGRLGHERREGNVGA